MPRHSLRSTPLVRQPFSLLLALLLAPLLACSDVQKESPPDPVEPASLDVTVQAHNEPQTALVGTPLEYDATRAGVAFRNPRGTGLTYIVSFEPSANGLSAVDGLITGVPRQTGVTTAIITAVDRAGSRASDRFAITVRSNPVRLEQHNEPRTVLSGIPLDLDVSQGGTAFSDPHATGLSYTVTVGPSANGLTVTGTRITGVPASAATMTVTVRATDGHGSSASDAFTLTVLPSSAFGIVAPHTPRGTEVGQPFVLDAARGGALVNKPASYTVTLSPAGSGLTADGATIAGTPRTPGFVTATVTARTAAGETASQTFRIVVFAPGLSEPVLPAQPLGYSEARAPLPRHFSVAVDPIGGGNDRSAITDAGATLGRVLFYDQRLSANDTRSCSSCHEQQFGFSDTARFSRGFNGSLTPRHSMALANAGLHASKRFFWDERAATLEAQVLQPIVDAGEMGMTIPALVTKLQAVPFYAPLFTSAFGSPDITRERIASALTMFIRSLVSGGSKFDAAFASGVADFPSVFTQQELLGRSIFRIRGNCNECHEENAHTADGVRNNGLDESFTDAGAGHGRFRAPSLRNVAVRGRFMHDGRFRTLAEVIDFYDGGVQNSRDVDAQFRTPGGGVVRLGLSASEKAALEAYLHTLTDRAFLSDVRFSNPFRSR